MSRARDIKEYLRAISGGGSGGNLFITGHVKSYEEKTETCTVDIDGLEVSDVRTGSVIDIGLKNSVKIIPKNGSCVLMADLSGGELRDLAIISYSEIECMTVKVGEEPGSTIKMDKDCITINGGNLGGLVKMEQLNKNINSIKTYCEQLKGAVSAGLEAIGVGTAANGGTGKIRFEGDMSGASIVIEGMEDDKIKH